MKRIRAQILQIIGGLSCALILGQEAVRYEFLGIPDQAVIEGNPIRITLQALTSSGSPAVESRHPLVLTAERRREPGPVISEVGPRHAFIEITVPGGLPFDLSGWEIQAFPVGESAPRRILRIPPDTRVPGGGCLIWGAEPVEGVASFPQPEGFESFDWSLMSVLLRDPAGAVADQVVLQEGGRLAAISRWRGLALGPTGDPSRGHSRLGSHNQFGGQDWTRVLPSPGVRNPGLNFPWVGEPEQSPVVPGAVTLSGGSWSGEVRISGTGSVVLSAMGTNGLGSISPEFSIVSETGLSLILGNEVLEASESQPGRVGAAEVRLNSPLRTNLTVHLKSSPPTEFAHLPAIKIAAGETRAQFALTNLDDLLPDGAASVTLSASADGFGIATAQLVNGDNESGSLFLRMPASVREGSGWQEEPAFVLLAQPSAHDVLVDLEAGPTLRVPPEILIAAGHRSAVVPLEVLDDALYNERPEAERVRATVRGWPPTEQTVLVVDDESPEAILEMPGEVVEGIPAEGRVRLQAARNRPVIVGIRSHANQVRVPSQVVIPAGSVTGSFPILAEDNTASQLAGSDALCVTLDGQHLECRSFFIADDEASVHVVHVYSSASAALDGEPFPIEIRLLNDHWQVQRTNALVRLHTTAHPSLLRVAAGSEWVQITNGVFNGSIRLEGAALGVQLIATSGGLTGESFPVDVLRGHSVSIHAVDMASSPKGRILLLESGPDQRPSQALVEVDPATGARLRTLRLPRPAVALDVSDNSGVAWLASETDTLQRVDLERWEVTGEVVLPPGSRPTQLLVLAGGTERVVVQNSREIIGRLQTTLVGVEAGMLIPGELPAWLSGLCRGRTSTEFFGIGEGRALRMEWTSNGILEQASWPVGTWGASLFVFGDLLFGGGVIYDPQSMIRVDSIPQGLPGTAVYFPRSGTLGMLRGSYGFQLVDPDGWESWSGFGLPATYRDDENRPLLERWGSRGIAVLNQRTGELILAECPPLDAPVADLELSGHAPAIAQLTSINGWWGDTAEIRWELTLTNRGPGVVPQARIFRGTNGWSTIGTLAPNEGRTFLMTNFIGEPALLRETFVAEGVGTDPDLRNNRIHLWTEVHGTPFPGTRTLHLPADHLIATPAGDRLFAAVPASAGAFLQGVAEIDPVEGRVLRVLTTETGTTRLAISPDGTQLYARTGPRQLQRWNLPSGEPAGVLETADPISDFLVFPGPGRSVFVATTAGLEVHGPARTSSLRQLMPGSDTSLAVSRGMLWWVGESLQAFQVSGSSLNLAGPLTSLIHPPLPSGVRMDDLRLYRQGLTLDLDSRLWSSAIAANDILPDAAHSAIFSLNDLGIFRHDPATLAVSGGGPVAKDWGNSRDLVRWGDRGFAFRTLTGLIYLSESGTIPAPETCDLAIEIRPAAPWSSYAPFSHQVMVTNRSDHMTGPFQVTIMLEGEVIEMELAGLTAHRLGNTLIAHVPQLAPHGSVPIVVRGSMRPGPAALRASVVGQQTDPVPANNQASFGAVLSAPQSRLVIERFVAPARAEDGGEIEVTAQVRNLGPELAPNVRLHLDTWMSVVSASPGTLVTDCCSRILGLGTMESGGTVEVSLRLRVVAPGLNHLNLIPRSDVSDPNRSDGVWQRLVYVPGATNDAGHPGLLLPLQVQWNEARQQLVGAPRSGVPTISLLSKDNLEVVTTWDLPGPLAQFTLTSGGGHVWALLNDGRLIRVNLETGALDFSFSGEGLARRTGLAGLLAPPGHPENLVVANEDEAGDVTVALFRSGVRAPDSVRIPGGALMPISMAPGRGGIFVSTGQRLRQLAITAGGLVEARNLDFFGGGLGMSIAADRLVIQDGRILRTDTLESVPVMFMNGVAAADPVTETIYVAGVAGNLQVAGLDPESLATRWLLQFPDAPQFLEGIVPMGTNGLLVLGNRARVIPAPSPEFPEADVWVLANPGETLAGTNLTTHLVATVAIPGPWSVPGVILSAELPPELEFADPAVPSEQRRQRMELGTVVASQSVAIPVRAARPGSGVVRWTVSSALPDPIPSNNVVEIRYTVLPAPQLLVEDVTTNEGSSGQPLSIRAALTREAPYPLEVQFRVTAPRGGERNVILDHGVLRFETGSRITSAVILSGDDEPGPDTLFQITFTSEQVEIPRPTTSITLLNDDPLRVGTWSNSSFIEGNSGISEAMFEIFASGSAGMRPVAFDFQIIGDGATEGTDFLPTSGRMVLQPGGAVARIVVPVVGDVLFEPSEWVRLKIVEVREGARSVELRVLRITNDDEPPAPRITASRGLTDAVRLEFDTVLGATYEVFSTPDPSGIPWQALEIPGLWGNGRRMAVEVPVPADTMRWIQIRAR